MDFTNNGKANARNVLHSQFDFIKDPACTQTIDFDCAVAKSIEMIRRLLGE